MGSKGIRARKPRRRLPPPDIKGEVDWPGSDTPGSQYTFEGYLRTLRRFVLGRSRAEGWQRYVATGLIWLVLLSLLAGAIIGALAVLWRLIGS